jgi:predicted secreted Zn-dependent protease
MRKCGAVAVAALIFVATPSFSKPTERTKYKFYPISGDTPVEIYSSMIRRGPDVNGVNAYASTSATSSQSGRLVLQGKSCRVDGYSFNIDFVINLPKLKNEKALTGATAAKWSQFKSFLKVHEETHRSIWMGCARQLESQVEALRSKDCKTLDRQAAQLWKKMRSSCDRKHAAFDAAEQKRLLRHPFVRLVLNGRARSTKGLETAKN